MNGLFVRMNDAMAREAQFTAMAAHELRTPLASLRVLAQNVRRMRADARARGVGARPGRSVDRCAHLQEQLLTLARLDAPHDGEMAEEVNLTEVISDGGAGGARRRGPRRGDRLPQRCRVAQRPFVRRADPAAQPAEQRVEVRRPAGASSCRVHSLGPDLRLMLDDSGSGIPPADRERMFERFERMHREQASGGPGPADRAQRGAAHRPSIRLDDSPLGGLRVVVDFRPAHRHRGARTRARRHRAGLTQAPSVSVSRGGFAEPVGLRREPLPRGDSRGGPVHDGCVTMRRTGHAKTLARRTRTQRQEAHTVNIRRPP